MSNRQGRVAAAEVSAQAYGRWLEIFQAMCPGMFDDAIQKLGQHVRCPLHGGEKDFRFISRAINGKTTTEQTGVAMCTCGPFVDGFALLQSALNKGFREVLCDVHEYLNAGQRSTQPIAPKVVPLTRTDERAQVRLVERMRSLWNAGKPIIEQIESRTGIENTRYFQRRGISPKTLEDVQSLRFIYRLGYYDRVEGRGQPQRVGAFPAVLGLLRDAQDKPVAVHRTWLSEDLASKAPVPSPRKLTQAISTSGSAIRLFQDRESDTLGLCEGIETALAVRELSASGAWQDLSKIPVWACFSANNLQNFQIPARYIEENRIRRVVVFSDNDENDTGLLAAKALKKRFIMEHPDIKVSIRHPEVMGWDWLDFLVNQKMQ